jgi:hypothetical protein
LTRSDPTTIPSRSTGHNPAGAPLRAPGRAEYEAAEARWLKRGAPSKADLKIVDLGQGSLVIKDFRHKPAWIRLAGRIQVRRECGAYTWLGPMPGLPRFAGRVDAHALAVEFIEGEQLAFVPERKERGAETHAELSEVVGRLHAAGLYHMDLRGRDNVLIGADGRVYVVDLAAAIWFRPGGWPHRWFSGLVSATDRSALIKWKWILGLGPPTGEDKIFWGRHRFWRSLWPFNRKK